MNLIKITFSAFVILFTLQSSAQNKYLKDIENAKLISKDVAQLFKENKINEAFIKIKTYWPLPENEIDNLESKTIQSMNLVAERFGNSEEIVKVSEQTIKETAFREIYLVKYENTALRLIFTYYRNNNGWIINGFKWDDSFTEEFK
jgi:pyruvate/2-oxoacid:ferredoxin oxidoreductase alpha subunit